MAILSSGEAGVEVEVVGVGFVFNYVWALGLLLYWTGTLFCELYTLTETGWTGTPSLTIGGTEIGSITIG